MNVTEAVKAILEDDRCEMSAEIINQLHGATSDHPFGKNKTPEARKLDALFAVAQARYVPVVLQRQLEVAYKD